MSTANEIITGAFQKTAIYQSADTIPPEDLVSALATLNDILNSVNASGGVIETVALALNDTAPIADQNLEDLKWFLGRRLCPNHGKQLVGDALTMARQGEDRFKAAYIKVYPARPDAGLRNWPSSRRW